MALFNPSNSIIQPWLDYSNFEAIPPLDSCYNTIPILDANNDVQSYQHIDLNCSEVCDKTSSLIDTQLTYFLTTDPDLSAGRKNRNLATCGIWLSTVSLCRNGGKYGNIDSPASGLPSISGCDYSDDASALALRSANAISAVLSETFRLSMNSYSQNSVEIPDSCTPSSLFPLYTSYSVDPKNLTWPAWTSFLGTDYKAESDLYKPNGAIRKCLTALCSPITLNQDLAGIGVFTSFMIQAGVALLALLASIYLEWVSLTETIRTQREIFVTALNDFHKAQCYFSSTIQIAALVLFHQAQQSSRQPGGPIDITANVLVVLAATGLVPIIVTLTCITRLGRLSWYLLLLTFMTMILATATLAASHIVITDFGLEYVSNRGHSTAWIVTLALCGTESRDGNNIEDLNRPSKILWFVWAICILRLLMLLVKKLQSARRIRKSSILERLGLFSDRKVVHLVFTGLLIFGFAVQLYLSSLYFKDDLISSTWTFGQIIAITVWFPSLFEFVYLEIAGIEKASKYRYPSPYRVMKDMIGESIAMATMKTIPQEGNPMHGPGGNRDRSPLLSV